MGISLADQLYQALTGSEVQVKLVDVQVKKMHASFGALNTSRDPPPPPKRFNTRPTSEKARSSPGYFGLNKDW